MRLLIILFLTLNLSADMKQNMFNLYQNEKYENVCQLGFDNFRANKKDEEFISLYALACLKSDYIDRLAIPIALLKQSPEARANSAYFSVILMQKKLLYHALVDNYNLSTIKLPSTEYILSKIFDLYSKLPKHTTRAFYLFEDNKDKRITYKLYLVEDYKHKKMIIEKYYDKVKIKEHIYW